MTRVQNRRRYCHFSPTQGQTDVVVPEIINVFDIDTRIDSDLLTSFPKTITEHSQGKEKETKKSAHQFVSVSYSTSAICDVCRKQLANKAALKCDSKCDRIMNLDSLEILNLVLPDFDVDLTWLDLT